MNYTKGEWKVGNRVDSEGKLVYFPIYVDGKYVSSISSHGRKLDASGDITGNAGRPYRDRCGIMRNNRIISDIEAEANARLIAAAPDMYEALKSIHVNGVAESLELIYAIIPQRQGEICTWYGKIITWAKRRVYVDARFLESYQTCYNINHSHCIFSSCANCNLMETWLFIQGGC